MPVADAGDRSPGVRRSGGWLRRRLRSAPPGRSSGWRRRRAPSEVRSRIGTRAAHCTIMGHAVDRIVAAAEARTRSGFPFMLTARAENHVRGHPDLDDTIARLQTYAAAGATSCTPPACGPGRRSRPSVERSPGRSTCSRSGHVADRHRRGGCPARERRRWSHLGRGRRDGRRRWADSSRSAHPSGLTATAARRPRSVGGRARGRRTRCPGCDCWGLPDRPPVVQEA